MRRHDITFANFICRFGDNGVLLDYAQSVVIPALKKPNAKRKYGETTYHLHNVFIDQVGDADSANPAIIGQFVKSTFLHREQIFDDDRGIIFDEDKMSSAPSAFFVLILSNHRLVYFAETTDAPSLSEFQLTCKKLITDEWNNHVRELNKRDPNPRKNGKTIAELKKIIGEPTIEIIALSGQQEMTNFISKFNKLKYIRIDILRPNHEILAADLIQKARELGNDVKAEKVSLQYRNSDGLDKEKSSNAIGEVASTGNAIVNVSGEDENGNAIRGNNSSFQLNIPLENVPDNKSALADVLYKSFDENVKSGNIVLGSIQDKSDVLKSIIDSEKL